MHWRGGCPGCWLVTAVVAVAFALAPASATAAFVPLDQDTRLSFMGPDGSTTYGATEPSVAYNPTADEYLVVWTGDDNTSPLVNDEFEIFAQRFSGSGAPLGLRIRVSEQGADGNASYRALSPSVAYNPTSREYLVAWAGSTGPSGEPEIWAQRLSASGAEVGGNDFQISDMGPDGNGAYRANIPSVAANPTTGEYLVVWYGDDDIPPLVNDEFEIFGQRLSAAGAQTGANDFRISTQGADGNTGSEVAFPSVAYNATAGEYLVAWTGEIGTTNDFEIWAQRLSAAGGAAGGNNFQISDMGPDGNASYTANHPRVAANPTTGEYLVVWDGDDDIPPLVNDEHEIFGQRLSAAGAQTGANDLRISTQGADGNPQSTVAYPSVAYDSTAGEYLVAWTGEIGTSDEFEIWAQRLSAAGAAVGGINFQISDMGPASTASYDANHSSAAVNPTAGEYLVVWDGNDGTPPLANNEFEIFGRRLGVPPPALAAIDPPGPANDNSPRVKGSAAPDSTIDVFTSANCTGAPAVNDAPASDLNGAGISVPVPDNATTALSATAGSDGRRSRCSNSISYVEVTPPTAGGADGPSAPGGGDRLAFGPRTLVTLRLAAGRIPARGPLKVRVKNANRFAVTGRLYGQTTKPASVARKRRIKLAAKSFNVRANARKTVELRLPPALRRLLGRRGKVSLRLTADVKDPAGNARTVKKQVTPELRRERQR
jgi:hypothetical protein